MANLIVVAVDLATEHWTSAATVRAESGWGLHATGWGQLFIAGINDNRGKHACSLQVATTPNTNTWQPAVRIEHVRNIPMPNAEALATSNRQPTTSSQQVALRCVAFSLQTQRVECGTYKTCARVSPAIFELILFMFLEKKRA